MKEKKQSLKSKVTYVKKNWMLYIFFLMPALLLTIIFKYVPMGGLLIAFKDYNVIKGVLGSPWVGLEYFKRFLSSPEDVYKRQLKRERQDIRWFYQW